MSVVAMDVTAIASTGTDVTGMKDPAMEVIIAMDVTKTAVLDWMSLQWTSL